MKKDSVQAIVRGGLSVLAMVLIWRLVEAAMLAGIDGVLFFMGVAAIAGLGGYQLRWMIEVVKGKRSKGEQED